METIEKRKYKKFDSNSSDFGKLITDKNVELKVIADALNVGMSTFKKYVNDPMKMTGEQRKVVSQIGRAHV